MIETRESIVQIHDFIEKIKCPFIIVDKKSRIKYSTAYRLSSYHGVEKGREYFSDRIHKSDIKFFMGELEKIHDGKKYSQRFLSCRVLTFERWHTVTLCMINMLKDELYKGILLIISDNCNRTKIQKVLNHKKYHDSDSGLMNRKFFIDSLRQEIYTAKKHQEIIALIAVSFNTDDKGEEFSGITEIESPYDFAEHLSSIIRSNDCLYRYAQGEFLLIVSPVNSLSDLEAVINKLLFVDIVNISGPIRRHIGVSFFPYDGIDALTLMERSIIALEKAKISPMNYEVFHNDSKESVLFLSDMREEIAEALTKHEFVLYYQPKLDNENNICGAEALLRWKSSGKGWIFPSKFIPVAEKTGLISELDVFVLNEACRQIVSMARKHNIHIPIAVNVSPSTFENHDFHIEIKECLDRYGISPQLLEIEITETGLMENLNESIIKLHAIKNLGVKISIDDFGTGYSSLAELRDYPLDVLKIDKSFISDLENDNKASVITESIIHMAKALNMEIVAEGIEQEHQFHILKGMGCEKYQGYLFGKPMPFEELINQLNRK